MTHVSAFFPYGQCAGNYSAAVPRELACSSSYQPPEGSTLITNAVKTQPHSVTVLYPA
jgi:hypothetical protein